jgi:hypothetical protein
MELLSYCRVSTEEQAQEGVPSPARPGTRDPSTAEGTVAHPAIDRWRNADEAHVRTLRRRCKALNKGNRRASPIWTPVAPMEVRGHALRDCRTVH